MYRLEINENMFVINDQKLPSNFSLDTLIAGFGEDYCIEKVSDMSYVDSYRWHQPNIFLNRDSNSLTMSSKNVCIIYKNQRLSDYYAEHEEEWVALEKSKTAFNYLKVADQIYVYIIENADSIFYLFRLGHYTTYPFHKTANETSLQRDPQYLQLWHDWVNALSQQHDEETIHDVLQSGVTQHEIDQITNVKYPVELLALYTIHDVNHASCEWLFTLDTDDAFELLSFADIAQEWEAIQDLIEDTQDMLEDDYFGDYDLEIDAHAYAKPEWIPIATDKQGDYLLIDMAPSARGQIGQIIALSNESWDRYVVADSLYALIREKITQLNAMT
ncbi:SMI1/KNR4 family protein [Acinetobacter sp. B5B]|uniref:SMI1/KNR4 family protein n=1 Tax=Acinetobacter baretiae TaxID=2605383 RepID=UPI0018C23301|nr:SMI1/KNR4 family protein [Acinetobacter baretiae]MBF7683745.1 SMI1/KNR4 family protein [Acinetobacter baretiae]